MPLPRRALQWLASADWEAGPLLRFRRRLNGRLPAYVTGTVQYPYYGRTLTIPYGHALPSYRRNHPSYDTPLAKIVHTLSSTQPVVMIDVGANIGDSAAVALASGAERILCIEGDPLYLDLLTKNFAGEDRVSVIPALISDRPGTLTLRRQHGTASISATGGTPVIAYSFEECLATIPSFREANLLKVDTDGYDLAVLRSAKEWLTSRRPHLFFEYDPALLRAQSEQPHEVWGLLEDCGYRRVRVFTNYGDRFADSTIERGPAVATKLIEECGYYVDVLATVSAP